MTIDDRIVLDLSDLQAVRVECATCGAALSLTPAHWKSIPGRCPACAVEWHDGAHTDLARTFDRLALGLRGAIALLQTEQAFRLRLEITRPR